MGRESNASIAHFFNRDCVCYHLRTFNLGVLPFRHDGRRPIWQAKPNAVPPWSLHRRFLVSLSPPGSPQPRALSLNFSPCLFYLASARRATNGSNRYSEAGEEARPAPPPYPLTHDHDHDPPHRTPGPRSPPHYTTSPPPLSYPGGRNKTRSGRARARAGSDEPRSTSTALNTAGLLGFLLPIPCAVRCRLLRLRLLGNYSVGRHPPQQPFSSCFPLVRGRRPGRLSEG